MPDLRLVALYSPEHGIRGVAETRVASTVDEKTGLPIHSLYGDADNPTPQRLEGLDELVYAIQAVAGGKHTHEPSRRPPVRARPQRGAPIAAPARPTPA